MVNCIRCDDCDVCREIGQEFSKGLAATEKVVGNAYRVQPNRYFFKRPDKVFIRHWPEEAYKNTGPANGGKKLLDIFMLIVANAILEIGKLSSLSKSQQNVAH